MIQSTPAKSRLLTAIHLLPATMLLAGALSFAPGAGATGCHVAPRTVAITGGGTLGYAPDSPQERRLMNAGC